MLTNIGAIILFLLDSLSEYFDGVWISRKTCKSEESLVSLSVTISCTREIGAKFKCKGTDAKVESGKLPPGKRTSDVERFYRGRERFFLVKGVSIRNMPEA